MRVGMASAACFLLSLTCDVHPATAQSDRTSSQPPQVGSALSLSKPLQTEKIGETAAVPSKRLAPPWRMMRSDPASESPNPELWSMDLLRQGKGLILSGLPQLEGPQCGHIVIFQAPNMDSQIIQAVPRNFSGHMPTFPALPPCCRDFTTALVPPDLHRATPIPPGTPLLRPWNGAPALDLETFKRLRP